MLRVASFTAASGTAALLADTASDLIAANENRNALRVQLDPAATGKLYLILSDTGTPSATRFDVALNAGEVWNGTIGAVTDGHQAQLYVGAIRATSAGAVGKVAVLEV